MEAVVDEAVSRTGGRFTEDEVRSYINAASAYVQKPIHMLLAEMLAKHGERGAAIAREIDAIAGSAHNRTSMAVSIDGDMLPKDVHDALGDGAALQIWLAIGERNYVNNLAVPDDNAFCNLVYGNYDMLRKTAMAYWETFKLEYPTVYGQLAELFGSEKMATLVNPEDAKMTLCWDTEFPRRIVIMSAYRNKKGFFAKKR